MNNQQTEARGRETLGIGGQQGGGSASAEDKGLRYEVNANRFGGDGESNVVAQFSEPALAAALLPIIAVQTGCLFAELFDKQLDQPIAKSWRDENGMTFTIPAESRFVVREKQEGKETWDIVGSHVDEPAAVKWYESEAFDLGRRVGGDVQLVDLTDLKVIRSTNPEETGTDLMKKGDYLLRQEMPLAS